jgi:hypothetical protein
MPFAMVYEAKNGLICREETATLQKRKMPTHFKNGSGFLLPLINLLTIFSDFSPIA